MSILQISLAFLALTRTTFAALNGPCSVNGASGVCLHTADCSDGSGTSTAGFCPDDPADVKCCTKSSCGSGGDCRWTSSCSGTTLSGQCPGPTDFKCCIPSSSGGGSGGGSSTNHQLSDHGAEFIAGFEGFRADFYRDAAVCWCNWTWCDGLLNCAFLQNVKTIGYGHACQPDSECDDINAPITKAEGQALLKSDAATFVNCINKDVKVAVSLQILSSFGARRMKLILTFPTA